MATTSTMMLKQSERRRVVAATLVGTTVEWYDFFIYASAASLVFTGMFFEPAGEQFGLLLSFASIGISFLFRPLGAVLSGHFGDKYGRRGVLVVTLVLMGAATALIGLLPTYAQIGVAAPVVLIVLRIAQGISAGGEWGGAALLAVEHAPTGKRGLFGAAPQVGVPLGLLLASGVMSMMTLIAPGDAFLEWGWRIPFLLSVVLIIVGFFVRRSVDESPVFADLAERKSQSRRPLTDLFRKNGLVVLFAALVFAGSNAIGYITVGGFVQNYATNPDGPAGLSRGAVLLAISGAAVVWFAATWVAGPLSDRFGRRRILMTGWAVQSIGVLLLFPLMQSGNIWLLFLAISLLSAGGLAYGPLPAMYAELFPSPVRFSGASISYALGAILGGAFAPLVAALLLQSTGSTTSVTIYLITMTVIGCIATALLRDRTGSSIDVSSAAAQEEGRFVWEQAGISGDRTIPEVEGASP